MLRIALTGGSGFVGRHLVPRLSEAGHDLHLATRKNSIARQHKCRHFSVDLIDADIGVLCEYLAGCDILIHLAGEIHNPARMYALNVEATAKLAEAAAVCGLRHWIQLSSCGVYGRPSVGIVTEDSPKRPSGLYETTKWDAELILQNWGKSDNRRVTILRPSIIWGADMPNDALRSLARMVKRGLFFYIGPAGSLYPLVHVEDVCQAVLASVMQSDPGVFAFNLSDNVSFEELITTMALISDSNTPRWRFSERLIRCLASIGAMLPGFPLTQERISAMTGRARYSSEAAAKSLGWKPTADLSEGLSQLIGRMNPAL